VCSSDLEKVKKITFCVICIKHENDMNNEQGIFTEEKLDPGRNVSGNVCSENVRPSSQQKSH
jgi:hypothetical protein